MADAIELALAFGNEDYREGFSRADFQHLLATESLGDDDHSYLAGDEADECNMQFDQALALIDARGSWLDVTYPFGVIGRQVRFIGYPPSPQHLVYLFLLVCSNGNFLPTLKKRLPVPFEDLCKEALRSLFPEWAEVVCFSQHSEDRKKLFGYSASEAVPKLAEKLNAQVLDEERLKSMSRPREFGIDIVAICSLGDKAAYPFFAFAQCTIAQEWWEKAHEARADSGLTAFVNLNAGHSNFLMIPHLPRYTLEQWSEDPARTGNCIIGDRFRICNMLGKADLLDCGELPERVADVCRILKDNIRRS